MAQGPADKVLDSFKMLVFDPLVKVGINQILGLAGWLSFGPVAFIITKVVTYVADVLYTLLRNTINFEVILLLNEAHHDAYVKASADLQGAFDQYGPGSEQFKKLRAVHGAALSKFVRWADA
jgi:hypothetical protein